VGLEIKCAVRSLLRSPVYSVAVALTVALCLALSWTVYVEVGPALVGQLPFARQPGRLVSIGEIAPSRTVADPVAPADFELLHGLRTLSAVAAYASGPGIAFTLTGRGAPRRYQGCVVSGKFFQVMQARAALGRLLAPPDNLPAAAPAVVLSHRLWVRRFGASPAILGQGVDLNGIRYEVVGVARGGAAYPPGTDIWVSKLR
jgi:putative ABC transport system permease protein